MMDEQIRKQLDRELRKASGKPQKPLSERIADADALASKWLADGNAYNEAGNSEKAEYCYGKSQFWKDRYNLLTNQSHKPAPKE